MPAATDRIEFAPPPAPGRAPSFALAVLAHVLLMLALTWGISWNRQPQELSVEAELWSSVPHEAAPAPVAPPEQPVVQAPPVQAPPPQPAPPPPAPAPAPPKQPDIKLEQQKRRQEEAQREQEQQRQQQLQARQQELQRQKDLQAQRQREEQQQALKKQQQQQQRALAEKKKAEELAKAKAKQQQEAKLREQIRQETMKRIAGLAGATGSPSAAGSALHASGPSKSYAGRIAARIRPNIVFTDVISGNPAAVVHLRVAPDGTIVGSKLVQSSGVKSWDDAVLRAIDKTQTIPRDTDGTVVPEFDIVFRPKD